MGQTFSQEFQQQLDEIQVTKIAETNLNRDRLIAAKRLSIDPSKSYNFAFVGRAGVGKSCLINALRGIFNETDINKTLFADIGDVQCTDGKPKGYIHPQYKAIVLWDLPGGETIKYPIETYFADNCLDSFDFLVILVNGYLAELDIRIAIEADVRNIPFAFVMTKADEAVDDNMSQTHASLEEAKVTVCNQFKQYMQKQWSCVNPSENIEDKVYIISQLGFKNCKQGQSHKYQLDEAKLVKMALKTSQKRRCMYLTRMMQGVIS